MHVLSKVAFFEQKKPDTFSASGPYKAKEQFVPGKPADPERPGSTATADNLINLVKVPVKKSPVDMVEADPMDKMMQHIILLQLISQHTGNKPIIGPEQAGPLAAMQALMQPTKAAAASPDKIKQLIGDGGIEEYARRIIKELKPEHYDEAGGSNSEETLRNLVEDVIPKNILREHASRIGRGNVDTGNRLLDEYLAPSFQDTGETLPKTLKRLLTGHVKSMREADKYKSLLGVKIETKSEKKKPSGVADWMSIIESSAPKAEQDPFRFKQHEAPKDDAAKYGSCKSPYRDEVLVQKLGATKTALSPGVLAKKVLKHPLTWMGGAALGGGLLGGHFGDIASMLSKAPGMLANTDWLTSAPALGAGIAGVGAYGAHHGLMRSRAPSLAENKVSPFYTPAEGGKARALTVTPDMLNTVIADNPQVGALARAAGPDVLNALSAAGDSSIMGMVKRFGKHFTPSGPALAPAMEVLKHLTYATHGDPSTPESIRKHIETITGQQGGRAGKAIADALQIATGNRGALGSAAPRSAMGDIKLQDNFGDQVRQMLLQKLTGGLPMASAKA